MASAFNGIEYALMNVAPVTGVGPGLGARGNKIQTYPMSYVLLGTESASVTLTMGLLPKGCIPLGGQIWATADQGATASFAVGVTGTVAKYMATQLLHTAAMGPGTPFSMTTGPEFIYGVAGGLESSRLTGDDTILVTITAASPAAGTLFLIMYALQN